MLLSGHAFQQGCAKKLTVCHRQRTVSLGGYHDRLNQTETAELLEYLMLEPFGANLNVSEVVVHLARQ